MIVEELYDALIEAGATEEKARAASRAIADMQGHFTKIEADIQRLDQKISELRYQVDGTLRLHNWGCVIETLSESASLNRPRITRI